MLSEPEPKGLTAEQARERLVRWGPNRLPDAQRRTVGDTAGEVLREPMFILLLLSAALYLVLGDLGEGLLLGGFALVTVGMVVWQGQRRERALQALRNLTNPRVQVRRDGQWQALDATLLVPGDCILVEEGQRLAADGQLLRGQGVSVDESLLTGESWPIAKDPAERWSAAGSTLDTQPAASADCRLWAGTVVVRGQGVAEVLATGLNTRMGAIGLSLSRIEAAPTPTQRRVARLVRVFGSVALLVATMVALIQGWRHGDWWGGLLSALALGMGMLPEEFPMALAIFMALGAWRLSRLHVLARRPAAIEALGALTVLCVDKTGTLTENRMRLAAIESDEVGQVLSSGPSSLEPKLEVLLDAALKASRTVGSDPVDQALWRLDFKREPSDGLQRVDEYGPEADEPVMRVRWKSPGGGAVWFCKGAPETVVAHCQGVASEPADRLDAASCLAQAGWRVLAVAKVEDQSPSDGDQAAGRPPARGWQWLGLIAFEDPLRVGVSEALSQVRAAGVRVVMVTGDHEVTAQSIARQSGLNIVPGVLSGQAFAALSEAEQDRVAAEVCVFARVQPQHKLALVQALQRCGQVVAMTGDGVNDAPALRAAHVGLAMGDRGTDVAREAASMVLLEEDFAHIVSAMALGRRLMDNLRKVASYITAVHVPLAGMALLPLLLGWPPLLLPPHVVLTEMVIDPMCSLAFEDAPAERSLMSRPPRRLEDPLLMSRQTLMESLVMGLGLLLALLALAWWLMGRSEPIEQVRTTLIVALTAGSVALAAQRLHQGVGWRGLILARSGAVLMGIALASILVLATAMYWGPLRELLRLTAGGPDTWGLGLGVGSAVVVVFGGLLELLKHRKSLTSGTHSVS